MKMDKYEIMFIVKATNESQQVKETAEGFRDLLKTMNSNVVQYKELGQKKLAYPIKKEVNGYYFDLVVEASHDAIEEFDRKALIDENILRHLIIKLDKEK